MEDKNKKYPEGHFIGMWIGIGVAVFSGVWIPLSFALDNSGLIGVGPALGVSIGLAIGVSIEEKHKREGRIRPLTLDEKKKRDNAVLAVISILTLGLVLGAAIFLSII